MKPRLIVFSLLLCLAAGSINEKDLDKVKLDQKGFDKIKTIHVNWYVHSMKALMVSLSKELLPLLNRDAKLKFLKCLAKIKDKKDIESAAYCLAIGREDYEDLREQRRMLKLQNSRPVTKSINKKAEFLKKFKAHQKLKMSTIEEIFKKSFAGTNWEKRRSKMMEKLQKRRRSRAKRSLRRLVVDSVSKSDSHGFTVKSMKTLPGLKDVGEKSPVGRVTNLFRSLFIDNSLNETIRTEPWSKTYETILKMKKRLDEREKSPGARVYNQRMYDLVMDLPEKDSEMNGLENAPEMMKQTFDLLRVVDKKKGSGYYKFLSPRVASIMPDKNENRGSLSPSFLSFYNDESEDQILPLPKLLDATGIGKKDRENMMEMIIELSGTKKIVYEAMKVFQLADVPEVTDALSETARKTMTMVQEIQNSYSGRQRKSMEKKGYAILQGSQIKKVMENNGIADRKDIFDVESYDKKSFMEKKEMVWDMVRSVAFGNQTHTRRKRATILRPTVLSPVLFTPVYDLAVLSPVVLSPGLFTPLILNPAVLSPYVFSPTVGIPFILSPYLMSPYVFSPLVFAPFILTPYVLAPNVFNPYVLSPLILSPLVLCPDTVSPMVLGGAILSPGVLSPSVLSKSYLMANVLSPTVLS